MLDASDIKLETDMGSKLSGGASKSGSVSAKIPYGFTGNAYILLVADHEGKNPDGSVCSCNIVCSIRSFIGVLLVDLSTRRTRFLAG
jgi:hypothetical protein